MKRRRLSQKEYFEVTQWLRANKSALKNLGPTSIKELVEKATDIPVCINTVRKILKDHEIEYRAGRKGTKNKSNRTRDLAQVIEAMWKAIGLAESGEMFEKLQKILGKDSSDVSSDTQEK